MTTLADVLDAMERNGYTKIQSEYIEYDYSMEGDSNDFTQKVFGACAIGQAALNLEIRPSLLDRQVSKSLDSTGMKIWHRVPELNDTTNWKVSTIAKRTRDSFIKAGIDLNLKIDLTENKL